MLQNIKGCPTIKNGLTIDSKKTKKTKRTKNVLKIS